MKKSMKIKRRAVSTILHASARAMEVGSSELFKSLRTNNAEGMEKNSPLRGALTDQEYRLIRREKDRVDGVIENLRKIANAMQRSATDHQ